MSTFKHFRGVGYTESLSDWRNSYQGGGGVKPPRDAEVIEMADHRVYFSTDKWQTATLIDAYGKARKLTGQALHHAQFLAVTQSSASPNWKRN
jgi:hypothetical protein